MTTRGKGKTLIKAVIGIIDPVAVLLVVMRPAEPEVTG